MRAWPVRRPLVAVLSAALLAAGCAAGCTETSEPSGTDPAPPPPPTTVRLEQPFGLKWNGYAYPSRYAPVIDSFRGGGTFHDITWCAVERAPGQQRWAAEDKVVDDALRRGYRLLIRIHVGSCWASGRPASPAPRTSASYPPADLTAYGTFVRTLVGRYSVKGVHLYAIENEIDAANYWGGDPRDYAPMARAGAAAVRQADPQAKLTDPGLSSSAYGIAVARSMRDDGQAVAFYRAFYARRDRGRLPSAADEEGLRAAYATAAGRRILAAHDAVLGLDRQGVFDIYQLHYYDPWPQAGRVLDHIRRRIPAAMPIEAWEVGSFWPGQDYDARRHARETAQLLTVLLAKGVRRVVYLPLFYRPGAIAPRETWRGLYGADGVARPAGTVLQRLREATRSGSWHALDRAGLRGAAVDQGRTTVLVVWSADGRNRVLTRPDTAGTQVTPAVDGASRPWVTGSVPVGADPIVITVRSPLRGVFTWLDGITR